MSLEKREAIKSVGSLLLASLVLATSSSIAQNCDVSLTRSSDGKLTRIQTQTGTSVIEFGDSKNWQAYLKNGNNLTTIDDNGSTNSKEIDNLDKTNLDQLLNSPLDGTSFATSDGRLTIDSTNGNKWSLGSSESAKHSLTGPNNELAALYCNSPNFTNVFVQNNSIVTLVDKKCQVMTLPINRLDDSTKSVIANLTQEASLEGPEGQFHRFGPPPFGPPPHHGRRGHPHPPPPPPPFGLRPHRGRHPPPPQFSGPFQGQPGWNNQFDNQFNGQPNFQQGSSFQDPQRQFGDQFGFGNQQN